MIPFPENRRLIFFNIYTTSNAQTVEFKHHCILRKAPNNRHML